MQFVVNYHTVKYDFEILILRPLLKAFAEEGKRSEEGNQSQGKRAEEGNQGQVRRQGQESWYTIYWD